MALFLAMQLPAAHVVAEGASVSFARDILPILSDHCFTCHGPDSAARKAGLRLDTREGAMGRGRSGSFAIIPGDPDHSEVIARLLTSDVDDIMPPMDAHKRPDPAQIAKIRTWIEQGAKWGRHWAFEELDSGRPPIEGVGDGDHGLIQPIDAFVRQGLFRSGLSPTAEASRSTLLRRVTLDLTGLPPDLDAVRAFELDESPDAYERRVDELLASPRFGERMAWGWLDAARYADSNGYQGDATRTMWPWRDWVIDALNRNLPYDLFTLWQLAGDRLPNPTHEQRLATGFLRNHMINGEGGRIPEENRIEYLFDQTETVATVWLGATFNCTRCHDHKYDAFTQRNYFSLLAFFNQTQVDGSGGNPQTPPVLACPKPEQSDEQSRIRALITEIGSSISELESTQFPVGQEQEGQSIPEAVRKALDNPPTRRTTGQLDTILGHIGDVDTDYKRALSELKDSLERGEAVERSIPKVMVMEDRDKLQPTFILNRGNYLEPGEEVAMGLPEVLLVGSGRRPIAEAQDNDRERGQPQNPDQDHGHAGSHGPDEAEVFGDRLALAQWLTSPNNPLTARVTVNRIWQQFFGIGLVKTSEDFGVQGEHPSHPELLDWLAADFIGSGWDIKRLVRQIVTSATYRQSSHITPEALDRDPENRWLARGPRFRMPSWMIRDVALSVAGLLDHSIGGPPVRPYQPDGVWEEATFGNIRYNRDSGAALYRRSVYVFWRRIVAPTLFFDVASRQTCSVSTPRTNVPLHALLTLNDVTYVEAARSLAQQLLQTTPSEGDRIRRAFQEVLSRLPTHAEAEILSQALRRHTEHFQQKPDAAHRLLAVGESGNSPDLDPIQHAAWTLICNTLLNLDEALTRE